MSPDDFAFLARLARRRGGLRLAPDRMARAARRLQPVMRRFHFKTVNDLIAELRLGRAALAEAVTEALTVNDTGFFRDADVFAGFRDRVLPRLLMARAEERRLRIWSAACATGQEAWSIAILLAELGLARKGWSIDLIATDLSADAIARAEEGRYDAVEMGRGLGPDERASWFRPSGGHWCIAPHLRRMVDFRVFNLLDSYGWLDDLDFIFCRNVLMYFDRAAKASVLERMADTLAADGLLLLGETETVDPLINVFAMAGGDGIYARNRAPVARLASG